MLLALDPSGAFNEGKGTTGFCFCNAETKNIVHAGSVAAAVYCKQEEYWDACLKLILHYNKQCEGDFIVVMEDYMLYADKCETQINSRMETPKLIGIIQYMCYRKKIPLRMQTASEVKQRWHNGILIHEGVLEKRGRKLFSGEFEVDRHAIDAIRHAMHYITFKRKKDLI